MMRFFSIPQRDLDLSSKINDIFMTNGKVNPRTKLNYLLGKIYLGFDQNCLQKF